MSIRSIFTTSLLVILLGFGTGCAQYGDTNSASSAPAPQSAVTVIRPTAGNTAHGTVMFTVVDGGVRVVADLDGLSPGKHGFHIHTYGDCTSADGTSAGGHFAPHGRPHGAPTDTERHVGDLGNVVADADGHAHYDRVDPIIALHGENSIIGRGVILHAGEDDLTSQPTGAAGARVACGVIGIADSSGK